ncbi:MAG: Fe-S cluster assembly protein SufD [Candidatus Dormibacteria bacterium]
MSEATIVSPFTSSAIAAAGHPDWLAARKQADLTTFNELPFPNASMEDWRRTDVSDINLDRLVIGNGEDVVTEEASLAAWKRGGEGGALLVQQGGRTDVHSLPARLLEQGVVVSSLEVAARTHPDLVRRYLDNEVVPAAAGKFSALNASFWRGGVFVYVPPGVEAELPVWSTVVQSGGANEGMLPRSLVVVEAGGSLVYTDEYISPSAVAASAVSSAVTEVVLGDGARVQYLVLQEYATGVTHVATHRIHLGRDCNAELVVAAVGAGRSKTYMEVALHGPGSTARISGLMIGDGSQHFDYQSLQDHFAPNCTSDLLIKGALRDRAESVYSGLIKIRKDAQHSDAYQANRNLLLSSTAKADSIPKLEIEANDVRCTHGATVGQVDPDQLFYLQARGIPTTEAQNLVVHGFFQPVIDRIALPRVREQLHEAIDRELIGVSGA